MKSIIAKFTAFGALAIALVVGIAYAQDGPGPMHHRGGPFMGGGPEFGMFLHQLNLTDDQKAQVKQIFQNEKGNMHPLMQQEMQSHQQLMQLITSGNFDQAKANAIAAQESQVHAQMTVEHAKIAAQIYQLLDSTQKAKVADIMAKHQQRMQEHMQNKQAPAEQQ